jgi:hypothetical protein
LLIEASGRRGYNSIAFRAAIETERVAIVNRKSTTQATIAKRSGQALVEFAIIAFVLSAILAGLLGILVLGLGSFQNNIAAENAGRVLDRNPVFTKANFVALFQADVDDPFAANEDFENVTARQVYRFLNEYPFDENEPDRRLYDESRLILSRSDWDNRSNLGLSAINESLLGQYIYDSELEIGSEKGFYRFPGAVVTNQNGDPTVLIPLLPTTTNEDAEGGSPPHGIDRSFNVASSDEANFFPVANDWVAPVVIGRVQDGDDFQFRIILFHPSQPASMIQVRVSVDENGRPRRVNENGLPDPNGFYQFPVEADDEVIDNLIGDPPSGYTLAVTPNANSGGRASPYGGEFGLGQTYAFARTLRPYRAVFETSSLFRIGESISVVKYRNDGSLTNMEDESVLSLSAATTDTPVPPFIDYEDHDDQPLQVVEQEIDGYSDGLRRYFVNPLLLDPPASPTNNFVTHVMRLLPNDDGVWRVNVSAEFTSTWTPEDQVQLWLYVNGQRDSLIVNYEVPTATSDPVLVTGQTAIRASEGDVLQVRVWVSTTSPIQLNGVPQTNWVLFERIGN